MIQTYKSPEIFRFIQPDEVNIDSTNCEEMTREISLEDSKIINFFEGKHYEKEISITEEESNIESKFNLNGEIW